MLLFEITLECIMQEYLMSSAKATQPEGWHKVLWVTHGMSLALSDLCHTTLLWYLHVPLPCCEIIPSGTWCSGPAQGGSQHSKTPPDTTADGGWRSCSGPGQHSPFYGCSSASCDPKQSLGLPWLGVSV